MKLRQAIQTLIKDVEDWETVAIKAHGGDCFHITRFYELIDEIEDDSCVDYDDYYLNEYVMKESSPERQYELVKGTWHGDEFMEIDKHMN